ncbi:MAG: RND family efflux transporter MFP subunit [Candidatus Peregrinibacteria bacterium Greene0416_19]|nr:MAG: RND family efflux transporter MFP subunit [Candidatus Peregrinibacteria bacterium Greene0416_19]
MFLLARPIGSLRRHKWKSIIGGILIVLIGVGAARAMRPRSPEFVTVRAERKDLRQTVEAVGTVIAEKDLALQFRSTGIAERVEVHEGESVKAGQRLVVLQAGNLAASVASAAARVQEMQAGLGALLAGTRLEDIAIAEAQVQNRRAHLSVARENVQAADLNVKKSEEKLQTLRSQASTNVSGEATTVASIISQKIAVAQQALSAVDDVFADNAVQDAVVKDKPGDYNGLRLQETAARSALHAVTVVITPDYQSAVSALHAGRAAVSQTAETVTRAYNIISSLTLTTYFTASDQATQRSALSAQRNNVQTAMRDLDAALANLQNLPANLQTQIAAEESALQTARSNRERAAADIRTYETSLRIDEAQLQLKRAGSRPEDIAAAQARLRQARAELARAGSDYGDTILRAPVDGTVTKVHVQPGEATPAGPAVEMIGASPYRIEMFVSEVDIPMVQRAQSGSIELDSFRGTNFRLHVSEIDPAATIRDGVPKYRVKLDFDLAHDELKIGMTGDAAITTGMRPEVVVVPRRAVLESADGKGKIIRIQHDDKTVEGRPVTIGMEGEGGEVEVSGVKEGEVVVVLEKK